MKNLNKKICAMALAGMMVAGGVGLSSASVAHAASSDIFIMASYNSNRPEDNEIFIKEFGGWFYDYVSESRIEIKNLGKVFDSMADLEKYLKEQNIPKGVYLASIKPDPNRERENRNILFEYKL